MNNQIEGIEIDSKRLKNLQFVLIETLDGFEIWRKKVGSFAKKIHYFRNETNAKRAFNTLQIRKKVI